MICQTCKDQVHEKCRGGTWCDCQHRTEATTKWESWPALPMLISVPDARLPGEFLQELKAALGHDRPDL